LEGESILQTMAEVSVALAGFTGVVAAFGQRRERWTLADTIRFQGMLGTSLTVLVFSILPFAIHNLGAKATATWAISSGLLAGLLVIVMPVETRRMRKAIAQRDSQFRMWPVVLAFCLASVAIITQVLNALGIGFQHAFGPFFLGLVCLLLLCALMFIRLLSFVGQQDAEA
jgi:hypothetical protein